MARLIILGASGSGRTTQAQILKNLLDSDHISTGQLLKQAIASSSDLGESVRQYVELGEYAPDDTMINLIKSLFSQTNYPPAWILEGYPRTAFQAEELDFFLAELDQPIDLVFYLDAPVSVLTERLVKDQDQDLSPEVISRQIELFHTRTTPLLEYYDYKKKLLTIDASGDIDTVSQLIQQHLS
ncbi:adenylate kinase-like kinase [Synechococcus sp. PCC 7502]|nr:adenylate kinase-like kinase [Synechococcus sp. PCC 7502]